MKLLVFNTESSKVTVAMDGVCIRLSYLIANDTIAACNMAAFFINIEGDGNDSLLYKLDCLSKDRELDVPDDENPFLNMMQQVKQYQKQKHKDGRSIALYKKWERSINDLYELGMKPRVELAKSVGLVQLADLSKRGEFIYEVCQAKKHEGQVIGKNHYLNAHQAFVYLLNGYSDEVVKAMEANGALKHRLESQIMMLLQDPFLYAEEWGNTNLPVDSAHPNAANNNMIVMEHFMNLPNINLLSAALLTNIKTNIMPEAIEFNTICNEWINLCYNDNTAAFDFYKDKILPAKDALAPLLEGNKVLKEAVVANSEHLHVLEIFIGMVPISSVIQFYATLDALTGESIGIFNTKVADMGKQGFRVPVIVCKQRMIEENKPLDMQTETLETKKYLDID